MFIEQLSNFELLYIVEMATSLHFPIEYRSMLKYEILDSETKKVRNKEVHITNPAVTDREGSAVEFLFPKFENINYSKEKNVKYVKISYKANTFGYVRLSDYGLSFYNVFLRKNLHKRTQNLIAKDYPLIIKDKNVFKTDLSNQETRQFKISRLIFYKYMLRRFKENYKENLLKNKKILNKAIENIKGE